LRLVDVWTLAGFLANFVTGQRPLTSKPASPSDEPKRRLLANVWQEQALPSALALGGVGGLGWMAAQGAGTLAEALPVLLAGGCVAGLLTYCRQQIRLRAALQQDLAQAQRACQAAETANLAKSRYLGNVSHEIRSPLNAIYGYAQLMERDNGAGAADAAVVIRRCSEHITSLVESLLDISQVEAGVIRLRSEPVRLEPFIEQILCMVRPAASAKGLDFDYQTSGRMPDVVRMDPNRLRQILLNLLLNAVKYTDKGMVTLHLRYSGQIATFEVRDTGPGIREEDQAAIFEPFERGGDDKALARPGVGLGLSISRAIADMLGGQLKLASSSPAGTCFRLTMMLGEVSAPHGGTQNAVQGAARAKRKVVGYLGQRRSILLCDDDAEQRRFLSGLLESLGFSVEAAPHGEAAVALAQSGRRFDLAILDISLPGMSGWDVAQHLRVEMGEELKIMMLSANAHEFHRPETRHAVHDHFLVKPVAFNDLIDGIGGLLDVAWRMDGDVTRHVPRPEATAPQPESAPVVAKAAVVQPEAQADLMVAAKLSENSGGNSAPVTTDRLREVLRIGYVRGIEQEIRLLAEQPETSDLALRLFACLDRYDLPAMSRILEEC
jgi:signal transduction histidine kinase/CheY-like chemotaxis protein